VAGKREVLLLRKVRLRERKEGKKMPLPSCLAYGKGWRCGAVLAKAFLELQAEGVIDRNKLLAGL
jgi:hypothetical protein